MSFLMSTLRVALVACIAASSAVPTVADPATDDVQGQIDALQTQVHYDWLGGRFDELEALATSYRKQSAVTGTGYYWLPQFYDGFTGILKFEDPEVAGTKWNKVYQAWIAKYPNSPTPRIANALFIHALGWLSRGHGYIDTVSNNAQSEYLRRIQECRNYLQDNEEVAKADPEFYALRAMANFELSADHVALAADLQQALTKFPWYEPYYFVAEEYFLPRWGGDPYQFSAWLDKAVDGTRSTHGTGMLAKLYWHSRGGPYQYADIANQGLLWLPRMKTAIADELGHFPNWANAKKFVQLACKASDPEEVKFLLPILAKAPDGRVKPDTTPAEYCGW